ncbi:MAG: trigger factor [Gaiellaceae bacterium]|jgi:trigger factor
MQAQVEELGDSKVRLTVEVPGADVKHAVDHAASDLADTVKIPGFRKGKVPLTVLKQRIGKDRLYAEAVESHIGGWFWNAAAQTRIHPVEQPEFDFDLPDGDGSDWRFTATVAVQPKPELPDWSTLEVPAAEPDVPGELVEQALQQVQATAADLAPVDDRPAQPGDVLVLDLVMPGDARRDYGVELGGGRLAPELEHALVGVSAGESASVEIPVSERETSSVEAKINEIHEKVLPPLDDELARKVSEFDSLAELRADLENDLREQLAAELEGQFRSAAVDTLVRAAGVNADGPLVEMRTRELLNGLARSVERRGLSLEQYVSLSGRTPQQFVDSLHAEAALSVAREVVLEAVADKAGITVADGEVDAVVREQVEEVDDDFDETITRLRETGGYERLREDLRLRAALDRLAGEVTRIPVELAAARESIWTPEKEKPDTSAKLWTPGSKEPA